MLEEIMRYLKNWFLVPGGVHLDTYTIEDGELTLSFLQDGQYFRIVGSVFNDGVYKYGDELDLTDETFDGAVWALAIPQTFLSLVPEIEAWQTKNADSVASPYTSESFGGYSYTKATDSETGGSVTWQSAFRSRLSKWRKI